MRLRRSGPRSAGFLGPAGSGSSSFPPRPGRTTPGAPRRPSERLENKRAGGALLLARGQGGGPPRPAPPHLHGPACCCILRRFSPRPSGASMRSIRPFTLVRTPVKGRERGCVGRNIETNNRPPPAQSHLSCSEMNFGKRLAPNLI